MVTGSFIENGTWCAPLYSFLPLYTFYWLNYMSAGVVRVKSLSAFVDGVNLV